MASSCFEKGKSDGVARTGRLAFPVTGSSHPTPLVLHGTDKGSLPHVPNPLLLRGISPYREATDTEAHPIAVSVGDITDHPGVDILTECPAPPRGSKISRYVGCAQLPSVLVIDGRDGSPCTATDTCVSVATPSGRARLGPDTLAALAVAGGFDLVVGPADHPVFHTEKKAEGNGKKSGKGKGKGKDKGKGKGKSGGGDAHGDDGNDNDESVAGAGAPAAAANAPTVRAGVPSISRVNKAVHRTIRWHRELLDELSSSASSSSSSSSSAAAVRPLVFASVAGSVYPDHRMQCTAALTAMTPSFDGFEVGGLQCGESRADRRDVISRAVSGLPDGSPRLVRASDVLDILDALLAGADVIHTRYASDLSDRGVALTFRIDPSEEECGDPGGRIAMRDPRHTGDPGPLVRGCDCFACGSSSHTRGYIHHLVVTHEILGSTLIGAHNTHRINALCARAREAIEQGRIAEYAAFVRAELVPK